MGKQSLAFKLSKKLFSRPARRQFLTKYINDGDIGAEIGVWRGDFSELVLSCRHLHRYYLIDPYKFMPELPTRMYGGKIAKSQADMDQISEEMWTRLASYETDLCFIRKKSTDASYEIEDGSLDFVYVDGNHYYDGVASDLELYSRKLRAGGFLMLDDWLWKDDNGLRSVQKAILDFLASRAGDFQVLEIQHGQIILLRVL